MITSCFVSNAKTNRAVAKLTTLPITSQSACVSVSAPLPQASNIMCVVVSSSIKEIITVPT